MARKDGMVDGVVSKGWAPLSDVRRIRGRGMLALLDIDERDVRGVMSEKPGERSAMIY
jgi:hypothetical protein